MFVLFEATFLFKFFSLSSKCFYFTKAAISFWLPRFACANLAAKYSGANLLNPCVSISLS